MEEIRAAVELGDPGAAVVADAPLLEAVLSKVTGDSHHTSMDQPDVAARSHEGTSPALPDRAVPDAGERST